MEYLVTGFIALVMLGILVGAYRVFTKPKMELDRGMSYAWKNYHYLDIIEWFGNPNLKQLPSEENSTGMLIYHLEQRTLYFILNEHSRVREVRFRPNE